MPEFNGTAGNNSISGTEDADVINGGAGNDTLRGFGGNDELNGQDDNDYLIGGLGDDTLDGGDGLDRVGYYHTDPALGGVTISLLTQNIAQDTVIAGWDTLIGIENVSGTPFADTLTGDNNNNWLWGAAAFIAAGNVSTTNNDYIDGGAGNDTIAVGIGNHTLIGGDDTDTLRFTENGFNDPGITVSLGLQSGQVQNTGAGNWTITGFENLSGGNGNDILSGNGQSNVLAGSSGDDSLSGGGGDDFLYGDGSYQLDITAGGGSGAIVLYPDVGEAFGGLTGNDTLSGGAGNDTLYGGGGGDLVQGGADNDTIYGGTGNDLLRGDAGDDYLDGGDGFDRASYSSATSGVTVSLAEAGAQNVGGGLGWDTLINIEHVSGTRFADTLSGDNNDNWLWGAASIAGGPASTTNHDVLSGGGGNDLLQVGIGNHTLDGGADNDSLSFTEGANFLNLTVDLNLQGSQNTGQGNWTITGIENVSSSTGNDVLIGDQNANVLAGELGDDQLLGGGGNDTLYGDGRIWADTRPLGLSGPITITADALALWVGAVSGNDYLEGGTGNDTLDGGGGIDTASYAHAANGVNVNLDSGTAIGADGNDTLSNIESIIGSEFNDTLVGSTGANVIEGLGGNDFILGHGGDDTLYGGDGDDQINGELIEADTSVSGNDTIYGGNGNDAMRGGLGDDTFFGGNGNDIMRGAAGIDSYDGGADDGEGANGIGDRVSFYDPRATQGVVADLRTGIISNDGYGNVETMVGVESLGADTAFVDYLYGNDGRNYVTGGRGDFVYGFGGDDLFTFSSAAAVIDGGAGIDRLTVDHFAGTHLPDANGDGVAEVAPAATAGWSVNLAAGTTVDGYGNSGTVTGIENVDGSIFGDTLIGDSGANVLNGFDGNDSIEGGLGSDTINGGNGVDTASYANAAGAVNVNLATGVASGAEGNDALIGIENLIGGASDDTLVGGTGDNVISGGGGVDTIVGLGGNDLLDGGAGSDNLYGMQGNDTLLGGADNDNLRGGTGDDVIDGGSGFNIAGYFPVLNDTISNGVTVDLGIQGIAQNTGQGFDTLINIQGLAGTNFADTLIGNSQTNVLIAAGSLTGSSGGDDQLFGMEGDDLLIVGSGTLLLNGGLNSDTISFNAAGGALLNGVTVTLMTQGSAQNTGSGSMTLVGIENLSGTGFADNFTGDGNANTLSGAGGDDTLNGGDGDDLLLGDGVYTAFTVAGPLQAPTLVMDATVYAGQVAGNDLLNGGAGNDTIYGAGGNDLIFGGDNADTIYGGDGNDEIYGGSITNSALQPLDEADTLYGEGGNDVIRGGGGDDYLDGGAGDDNLRGDLGNDTLIGGAGRDFVSYRFDDAGVTSGIYFDATNFAATATFTQSDGRGGTDTLTDVEAVGVTGSGFDDIIIGSQYTVSTATQVANQLFGFGGNDEIYGGGYWDQLDGGAGNDFIDGGGGGDGINGGAGNDRLIGGGGGDFIDGGADVDYITGGDGDDIIVGGAGRDRAGYYHTDAALGGVTVSLATAASQLVGGGQGSDTISGVEALSGTPFADNLTGDGGDNWLWGSAATISAGNISATNNDRLDGGAGNDLLTVGIGNHILIGGDGIDTVRFTENNSAVTEAGLALSLASQGRAQNTGNGSWTLTGIENLSGGSGGDRLTGDDLANVLAGDHGADTLTGGGGNDVLLGDGVINIDGNLVLTTTYDKEGGGNDTLVGGRGEDFLYGGRGNDTLTGGADSDWFVLQANSGNDSVTDFGRTDRIAFDFAGAPDEYGDLTIVSYRGGTLISWGTPDSIFLEGIRTSAVSAANFFFGAPPVPTSAAEAPSLKLSGDSSMMASGLRFDHVGLQLDAFGAHRTEDLFGI